VANTPASTSANGELWHWQLEAIADLSAFLHEHAPGTDVFLPVVPWRVGTDRSVFADLTTVVPDPQLLTLFAEALDTGGVEQEDVGDRTVYRIRWRIGPPDETTGRPRTRCTLAVSIGHRSDIADEDEL
jgi:hypothetical protein